MTGVSSQRRPFKVCHFSYYNPTFFCCRCKKVGDGWQLFQAPVSTADSFSRK